MDQQNQASIVEVPYTFYSNYNPLEIGPASHAWTQNYNLSNFTQDPYHPLRPDYTSPISIYPPRPDYAIPSPIYPLGRQPTSQAGTQKYKRPKFKAIPAPQSFTPDESLVSDGNRPLHPFDIVVHSAPYWRCCQRHSILYLKKAYTMDSTERSCKQCRHSKCDVCEPLAFP
jgi:hypothetical protein